jgi:hypothetical protein
VGQSHLPEVIQAEATAFNNALEGSNRNWLVPVQGDNHLPATGMPPFLMTALLTDYNESISLQYAGNIIRA